jgi:hypothetical protein
LLHHAIRPRQERERQECIMVASSQDRSKVVTVASFGRGFGRRSSNTQTTHEPGERSPWSR